MGCTWVDVERPASLTDLVVLTFPFFSKFLGKYCIFVLSTFLASVYYDSFCFSLANEAIS